LIPFRYQPGTEVFVRGISNTTARRIMGWERINGWPYYVVAGIDYPVIQQRLSTRPTVDK